MKLRLFLRRLTVSAPRVAVRSAMPWPLRWVILAVVAGFCAAIALWSFEFGKEIAGLDQGTKEQLAQATAENAALQLQLQKLTDERNKAQSVANTADTILIAEKAAHEKMVEVNRQLLAENQQLKDDLGFFEQLMPASTGNAASLSIRGVQAEVLPSGELQWQVLMIQSGKNPAEFDGRLELTFTGVSGGKTWSGVLPDGAVAFKVKQYGRLKGVYPLPAQTNVRSVTAKVFQGTTLRAVQTVKLQAPAR
ncbi:MAG: hypothetical protein CO066_12065 [Comamonadaceae bacterium CG_4_9_14_0_8_um_filter_60_18]|nr:MAG: hypothetical protein AUK52_11080 [Comamonadaceae bacterium CG2_30_60_41]PIW09164.1 MAG: hypothetical protein COW39_06425 [Comamonadaceae bacterium CG17_big_fil_post_rev_8_21_14_2_50_60_13]PIY26701.1 MAG: hypothetical protein COZ10_01905 [Comamonadaceae bacterium CG_4_10_14_3_um_filter_60_75]PJC12113.1 MAG: hypothetical protein CO066_12065 [Comamonadaceae bacterium CG_4_9_14_0_8_um_filter_60_18]